VNKFIDTPILGEKLKAALLTNGEDVWARENAVKAAFKICTDTSVHGMSPHHYPESERRDC
jgi:hypothetical protein